MNAALKSLTLALDTLKSSLDPFDPDNLPNAAAPQAPADLLGSWMVPGATSPAHGGGFGGSLGQTLLYAPDGGSGSAASAGGAGKGGGAGTTSVTSSTSSFVINISWDASVKAAPAAFVNAVVAAATYLESKFLDKVTMNLSIGYGEVNGTALGSTALGSTLSYLTSYSYSSLRNALTADATSTADASAVASLPTSSPVSGTFWATTADAKALGLASATSTATDAFIGFSSALPFTYDDSAGVAAGTYDFTGVALHEMTEAMGRLLLTGTTVGTTKNSYDVFDLFHYASAGVRDFSASTPGYFSINGGNTSLGTFNTTAGGDAGDWSSSMGYDSFDAFSYSGVVNAVTASDLTAVDVIGWNRAGVSTPAGVALAPVTTGLTGAQTASGLAANAALAHVTQTGGATGDSYAYALGGGGAAAFTLSTVNNVATLAVGSGGLAGAAGGQVYGLTLTATDTTSGNSAAASPLDVIVASAGTDTIGVSALTGTLGTATPTFVFGLAGADRLDGTGMTGTLWMVGGAGADTMTGGSGVTDYLYGAVSDSTAASMDVITNFHAGTDLIDLTGLGTALKSAGAISGTKLAAASFGWQTSGGNTFVYVNTTGSVESLTAANMKIELLGSISLTSGNIVHA